MPGVGRLARPAGLADRGAEEGQGAGAPSDAPGAVREARWRRDDETGWPRRPLRRPRRRRRARRGRTTWWCEAMRDELARSVAKLQIESLAKPYFIAYSRRGALRSARLGHFREHVGRGENRRRTVSVEVRVGSPALDNTNFLVGRATPSAASSPRARRRSCPSTRTTPSCGASSGSPPTGPTSRPSRTSRRRRRPSRTRPGPTRRRTSPPRAPPRPATFAPARPSTWPRPKPSFASCRPSFARRRP